MNNLYNKVKVPKKGINLGLMRNRILDFVKQQVQMGANPEQLINQILENNPQLKGMIEGEYGKMSYQEIAKRNGYDVQNDLSQLGL
jgi:hypothetical protein